MEDNDRKRLLGGHIGRGALLSFLIHGSFLLPFLAMVVIFGRRQAADHDLDVRFEEVNPAELPDDLRPFEPQAPEPRVAEKNPEQPTPEKPPQQAEVPVPQQPKVDKGHEKLVDLDMGRDVKPPPDAKYLAQKNNRAEEETRAKDTNLEREMRGTEAASSKSDRQDQEAGDNDRKVARDEDQKSKRGRSAPSVVPHTNPRTMETNSPNKSLLTMRDAPKRPHEVTPETADPSLARDPEGLQPL